MHNFEYPTSAAIKYSNGIFKGIDHRDALHKIVNSIYKRDYSHDLTYKLDAQKTREAKEQILQNLSRSGFEKGYVTNRGRFLDFANTILLLKNPELREVAIKLRINKELPKDVLQFSSDDWKTIYKAINPGSFVWGESITDICKRVSKSKVLIRS